MSKAIQWIVAIVAQQDGEHCFEYADLQYAVLSQPSTPDITYKIFDYDQLSCTAMWRTVILDRTLGVPTFLDYTPSREKVDLYKPETLTRFFQWALTESTDTIDYRYLVITWGHGAGLGYLAQLTGDPNHPTPDYFADLDPQWQNAFPADKKAKYNSHLAHFSFLRAHLPLTMDPGTFVRNMLKKDHVESLSGETVDKIADQLKLVTATELNGIFQTVIGQYKTAKKIDVLVTNTCYTQLFETGYALRQTVDLLVSPQTTIPFAGINYSALFELLHLNGNATPNKIAVNVKNKFKAKYDIAWFNLLFKTILPLPAKLLPQVSFSANLLGQHYEDLLAKVINPLAGYLFNALDPAKPSQQVYDLVSAARAACADVTLDVTFTIREQQYGIIDLANFITHFVKLSQKGGDHQWDRLLKDFEQLLSMIRLSWYKAQSDQMYTPLPGAGGSSVNPTGLSIFFPNTSNSDIIEALFDIYMSPQPHTSTSVLSKWPSFVARWYQHFTVLLHQSSR